MEENNEQSLKVERRPGWEFTIPGELLAIDGKRWTAEQRAAGVKVRCVYPGPKDERIALKQASAEQNGAAVHYNQAQNSISEIDGAVVPYIERDLVWAALGHIGRQVVIEMFLKANAADEGALAKARASFRASV